MFKKLVDIQNSSPVLTASEFLLLMNKWDKEFEDYMKLAESQCQTFKHNRIKWSPKVRVWLTR